MTAPQVVLTVKPCGVCGLEFMPKQHNAWTCSRACYNRRNRVPLPTITCASCGRDFKPPQRRSRACSRYCAQKMRRDAVAPPRPRRKCDGCGVEFDPPAVNQRYCSRRCGMHYRSAEHALRNRYGITLADYSRMADAQGHSCAICGDADSTRLAVDHDHDTGAVRSLLCRKCNMAIGALKDNSRIAQSAVDYLIRYGR